MEVVTQAHRARHTGAQISLAWFEARRLKKEGDGGGVAGQDAMSLLPAMAMAMERRWRWRCWLGLGLGLGGGRGGRGGSTADGACGLVGLAMPRERAEHAEARQAAGANTGRNKSASERGVGRGA